MADFEAFTARHVDPVSRKIVMGDGTGKRIEWHRRVAGVDTAIATLSDSGAAMFGAGLRVAAFTAGTVVSDASGNFSVSPGGGTVTLAGDVIGTSSANQVVGMHGTAGVVDMQGSTILWHKDAAGVQLVMADQTANFDAGGFLLQLSAPWVSASGINRNAPSGRFVIPSPAAGGTAGRWVFEISGGERLAVENDALWLGGSAIRFGAAVDNPLITQERQVGDVAAWDLSIESQSPSLTATGINRNASRVIFSTPTPTGAGAHGWHEFRIAGTPSLNVEEARLLLGSNVTAVDFASTTLDFRSSGVPRVSMTETEFRLGTGVTSFRSAETVAFLPDSIASAVAPGKGYFFSGGANSLGVGGELRFTGGQGVDADNDGPVNLRLNSGFVCGVRKVEGQAIFAVGNALPANCPAGGVDQGMFIVDAASVGDIGEPTGGFYLASIGGRPLLWTGDGAPTKIIINGGLQAPIPSTNFGSLWLDLLVGGVLYELAVPLGLR